MPDYSPAVYCFPARGRAPPELPCASNSGPEAHTKKAVGAELKPGLGVPNSWSWSCLFCTQFRAGFRGPDSWVLASASAPNPGFYPGFLGTRRKPTTQRTPPAEMSPRRRVPAGDSLRIFCRRSLFYLRLKRTASRSVSHALHWGKGVTVTQVCDSRKATKAERCTARFTSYVCGHCTAGGSSARGSPCMPGTGLGGRCC